MKKSRKKYPSPCQNTEQPKGKERVSPQPCVSKNQRNHPLPLPVSEPNRRNRRAFSHHLHRTFRKHLRALRWHTFGVFSEA